MGVWPRRKERGAAGSVGVGGIEEVGEGGEGERNNKSPPGQESCLQIPGQRGQACRAAEDSGSQLFSTQHTRGIPHIFIGNCRLLCSDS